MIKTKLIMVISSVGLVATLGVGCTSLNSKGDISEDTIIKSDVKEEASNEVANTDTNNLINNDNDDNNNDDINNNDANFIEEDNNSENSSALSNENGISSNNEISNYDEIKSEEQEKITTPSWDSSLNTNIEEDKVEDTNIPSQDSDNPGYDTNAPSETPEESIVSDSSFIAEIEQAIFERVNQERIAAGLPALNYNTTMEKYARIKSKDMGDNGYFSHEDLQGKLITEQMKADGLSYNAWGENIAYIQGINNNSTLATKFMDNWMNSSGHRANILSTNFSSIGIGVYKIGNIYYATQEFYR